MINKIRCLWLRICAIALLITGFVLNLVYYYRNGIDLVNSDSSSEMILAKILNDTGDFVITKDWFYSSELRVLNTQLIYRLGLCSFPDDWHLARFLSIAIFLVIIFATLLYFVKAFRLGDEGLLVMSMLMFPFGNWYAWNVLYSSFYVPHLVISMISLCLLMRSAELWEGARFSKIYGSVCMVLLTVLAFISGLGGVRQLMICYAPLVLVTVILCLCSYLQQVETGERPLHHAVARNSMILSLIAFLASGMGYLVNLKVLAEQYQFHNYSDTTFTEFSVESIMRTLSDFFALIGWQNGREVLSLAGIGCMLGLAMMIACCVATLYATGHIAKLTYAHRIMTSFFVCAFFLNLLMFSQTSEESNGSYWLPLFPFFFAVTAIALKLALEKKAERSAFLYRGMAVIGMIAVLFTTSYTTMEYPYGSYAWNDLAIKPVVTWLQEHHYAQGMATFWNSNVITELSNGHIEMWTIRDDYEYFEAPYKWLQHVSHGNERPQGHFFIIVSIKEYDRFFASNPAVSAHIVYEDEEYRVLNFKDWTDYANT
ncbi:MAG: hypothetical protein E7300_09735 [Lachnospiraceae bacterium]|nr:hypothetical protein [Lachnospiraceae bacterium]